MINIFDMFGFNIHRWTRFLAGFMIAPYLVFRGIQYKDFLLILFGIGTFVFDSITLYYTYQEPSKDVCPILGSGLIFGFVILGFLLARWGNRPTRD